jgi:release factor glutamine methyltransferase
MSHESGKPAGEGKASLTLDDLLREGREILAGAPIDIPRREAALLLARAADLDEARLRARTDRPASAELAERYRELLRRRSKGEPVAYLFGEREFFGRPFAVDSRVLVPRPETEHLVERALALELPPRPRILDLGTGSGCIAITLVLELPDARVVATDLSLDALQVARANARRHRLGPRLALLAADLAAPLALGAFDLVVSNPPYIDPGDAPGLSPEVRDHEPHLALFAPGHGTSVLERLLAAGRGMAPGVSLLLEIGHDQVRALHDAVTDAPGLEWVEAFEDYAGIHRVVHLRRNDVQIVRG